MNTQIIFYSAISTDGYIASNNKTEPVKWLDQLSEQINLLTDDDPIKNSYPNFVKDVQTIIIGSTTYNDILNFGVDYPYQDIINYVLTSKPEKYQETKNIKFVTMAQLEKIIPQLTGKTWLVGGGNVFGQLIDKELIDKIILTQMPVLLGDGIRFFQNTKNFSLSLERVAFSGNFVELEYNILK